MLDADARPLFVVIAIKRGFSARVCRASSALKPQAPIQQVRETPRRATASSCPSRRRRAWTFASNGGGVLMCSRGGSGLFVKFGGHVYWLRSPWFFLIIYHLLQSVSTWGPVATVPRTVRRATCMADDPKIVGFPQPEVLPEELIRRQRVEAERLAGLSPGEWGCGLTRASRNLAFRGARLRRWSNPRCCARKGRARAQGRSETRSPRANQEERARI